MLEDIVGNVREMHRSNLYVVAPDVVDDQEASFKLAMPQAELKKKLDEFAKKNEHMKGYSFMEPKKDNKNSKQS